jgi:hypothetical protein
LLGRKLAFQHSLGYDALVAGLAFSPRTIATFTMERVTPRLLRRFGPAPRMMAGTLGLAIGFPWLTVLPDASGPPIESLNARFRRTVRARGHFPNEPSAMKTLYLENH